MTSANPNNPFPTWLRLAIIAAAVVILSSCSPANGQECYCQEACVCPDACPTAGPPDEYLCDGGDQHLPAAVRKDWHIDGLEQEDTVAHYDTVDGRTVITPSNRVCIYAPRFASVRRVIDLRASVSVARLEGCTEQIALSKIDENEEAASSLALLEPTIHRTDNIPNQTRDRKHPGGLGRDQRLVEYFGIESPHVHLQMIRTGEVSLEERVAIGRLSLAAISWAGDQAVQVTLDSDQAVAFISEATPGTVYSLKEPNAPKLRLVKLASTDAALPGEEVEFTLRFDNVGNREIGNVTIVDNLTTRLEFVEGSDKSTVEADFSTSTNGRGSLILRWEIRDPVEPGKGGVLTFKCRVR